jgi:hypothetical protein
MSESQECVTQAPGKSLCATCDISCAMTPSSSPGVVMPDSYTAAVMRRQLPHRVDPLRMAMGWRPR